MPWDQNGLFDPVTPARPETVVLQSVEGGRNVEALIIGAKSAIGAGFIGGKAHDAGLKLAVEGFYASEVPGEPAEIVTIPSVGHESDD